MCAQVGVCRRLNNEVEAYKKEVIHNENRVQKMRDDGKDEYGNLITYCYSHVHVYLDIRKQEEVLQESYMMIPDSKRRLEAAIDDLRELLV